MRQGKNKWEQFIEMPKSYPQTDIAKQVIIEINEEEKHIKTVNWFIRSWKPIAACVATFIIALVIGIPVYNVLTSPIIMYYEAHEIVYNEIIELESFISEKGLAVCYYDTPMASTQCAIINETGETAFLVQDLFNITDIGFDAVNLKIIVKDNAVFDFYNKFLNTEEIVINNMKVSYNVKHEIDSSEQHILAQFTYQNVDYYMEISTFGSVKESIDTYVSMLIG